MKKTKLRLANAALKGLSKTDLIRQVALSNEWIRPEKSVQKELRLIHAIQAD